MLTLLLSAALAAEPTDAVVVAASSGDRLTLDTGDRLVLRGVSAPAPADPYGVEARSATRNLVIDQVVFLSHRPAGRADDGALIASVRVDGVDLAAHLLEQGYAWLDLRAPDTLDLSMLTTAQSAARAASRGVWSSERFAGDLHIAEFVANAPGDDRENVNGEILRLCNISARPVDLSDFTLRNLSGRIWTLPPVTVPVGHSVTIHAGKGINQTDASEPLLVYLSSEKPVWNNTEEQVTITDRSGTVVDAVSVKRR